MNNYEHVYLNSIFQLIKSSDKNIITEFVPGLNTNYILSKCNKEYILSEVFQNLYPVVQDMILFLYINKIISPVKRYKICLDTLKSQFSL